MVQTVPGVTGDDALAGELIDHVAATARPVQGPAERRSSATTSPAPPPGNSSSGTLRERVLPARQGFTPEPGQPSGGRFVPAPAVEEDRDREDDQSGDAEEGADIIALDICAAIPTVAYEGARRRTSRDRAEHQGARSPRRRPRGGHAGPGRRSRPPSTTGVRRARPSRRRGRQRRHLLLRLLWELSEEQFRTMIDVNVVGTWNTFKAAVPTMIAQGTGGSSSRPAPSAACAACRGSGTTWPRSTP